LNEGFRIGGVFIRGKLSQEDLYPCITALFDVASSSPLSPFSLSLYGAS